MTKTLVISDLHVPFHDEQALAVVEEVMKDIKFDNFVINGDMLDSYELSRFSKDPRNSFSFSEEIDIAKDLLEQFNKYLKGTKKYFLNGNHEERLNKYLIDQAPALITLGQLTIDSLLELDKYNYEFISMGKESYVKIGETMIGHFNKVSMHSAYTAKGLVDKYVCNIVQGHVHRLGAHYKTVGDNTFTGVEGGCLCNLRPGYVMLPNWQQGLTIITHTDRGDFIEPIRIDNGLAILGGVSYGSKKRS